MALQPGTFAAGTLRAMKSGLGGPELQGVSKTISRYAGLALHPYDAMYFSAPTRRTFNPRYTLIAEKPDEIAIIHQIVKMFKYCAMPGLTGKGSAFTYPHKFKITFYRPGSGEDDNNLSPVDDNGLFFPHFPSLMVCDSVDISYGDGDNLTLHEDGKGPIVVNISLMFREVDYYTKNQMNKETNNFDNTYFTPSDSIKAMIDTLLD